MEGGQNKALTGKMIGEEDGTIFEDLTPIKYVVNAVNMTKIPDCSLIELNLKSGDKTSMLK